MHAALVQMLKDAGVARLGIQGEVMTVGELRGLEHSLEGTGAVIAETRGLVGQLRVRKDAAEIATIRKAIQIQQAALKAVLPTIKPGQTELEIAARLEAEMKMRGASSPAFETIVAAQANGSLPHYRPHAIKLRKNQPLLIDWGAVYRGYRGDMTRTFALGKWPAQIAEVYKIVLDAHAMAAAALRAGATTKAVDAIARDHIAKHGYGDRFGHGLGHGLGLHTHEDPRLSHMAAETTLEAGMVVTIEPGIYIPGLGGVRIEDDYVVTEKGSENLCSLPKDIKWATLG
jgi:Xaa-Pro aminopeptidase